MCVGMVRLVAMDMVSLLAAQRLAGMDAGEKKDVHTHTNT